MEVDALSGKRKERENPARGSKVARKEKTATLAKVTEQRQPEHSRFMVSVGTAENTDTKLLTVGTSSSTSLQAKARLEQDEIQGHRISESDTSTQVEETCGRQSHLHNHQVCLK